MKLVFWGYLLILLWFSSTVYTFNTQRTDTIDDDDTLDYHLLLTKNQQKRILENLERVAAKSTEKPASETVDKRRVFFFYINNQNGTSEEANDSSKLDSWSIIWYVASFGGLIAFFLAISCSEWCCRHRISNNSDCTTNRTTTTQTRNSVLDTPPPSYDLFAPPSYESINLGQNNNSEKNEYDIYIVPVHMVGSIIEQDTPPSYSNIDQNSTTQR